MVANPVSFFCCLSRSAYPASVFCLGAVPKQLEASKNMLASVSTNIGIFDVDADADKNADAVWGLCWCKFHFFSFRLFVSFGFQAPDVLRGAADEVRAKREREREENVKEKNA